MELPSFITVQAIIFWGNSGEIKKMEEGFTDGMEKTRMFIKDSSKMGEGMVGELFGGLMEPSM